MCYAFVCTKCGKSHAVEEFRESRFCRSCGKFLTYRNRKEVKSGIKRELEMGDHGLFPYKAYPPQLEFMKDITKAVCNHEVLIVEACNGFGKTACALSSVINLGYKVVYATRTHEQVRQVLLELERINRKAKRDFSAVHLAGRQHLCLIEKCRKLSAREALETCHMLREAKKCLYTKEVDLPLSFLPSILSIRKLKEQSRINKVCPYFLARRVAEKSAVVVTPYQYVFNEAIRTRVKLEMENRFLIFDEAHNADLISQNVLSDTISERSLNTAKKEMSIVGVDPWFLDELVAYLDTNVSD